MQLTDRTVTATSPALPAEKDEVIIFDENIPGFGLRLRRSGSRSWIYQYSLGNRCRRLTLGRFPKISARAARELITGVGGFAARVANGQDPATEKRTSRGGDTFAEVGELYLSFQASRLKPGSLSETSRHLRSHAKALHNHMVTKISRRDVADLLAYTTATSGPPTANRVRSSISAMYNWAMRAGRAEANPAAFTFRHKEVSRDRVLSTDELARVWAALPEGDFGDIVKLLIFTGQRKREIGDLAWPEIDLERATITLPAARVKNGRQHIVPLAEPVRALICSIPKVPDRHLVFGFGTGGFSGWTRCKKTLDLRVGTIQHWTLHDLRRSAATGMADLGIPPHVIEAVLNHSGHKSGIAGVYNRGNYEREKREALTLWAGHVSKVIAGVARIANTGLVRAA